MTQPGAVPATVGGWRAVSCPDPVFSPQAQPGQPRPLPVTAPPLCGAGSYRVKHASGAPGGADTGRRSVESHDHRQADHQ
jgi:hypothetical protein